MIIAVFFLIEAIGRKKPEKYQGFNGIKDSIEAMIFFRLLPEIYCDDHSSLSFTECFTFIVMIRCFEPVFGRRNAETQKVHNFVKNNQKLTIMKHFGKAAILPCSGQLFGEKVAQSVIKN